MITMINNLTKKMKALTLQITTISETVINQSRISLLQKFDDASMSVFFRIFKLECFDCEKSDYNTIHCFLINVMCNKKLMHHDVNSKLC